MIRSFAFAAFTAFLFVESLSAATFNIVDYGATPNDDSDDTVAVGTALAACGAAGGGTVFVPAGKFIISRQGAESPILAVPSNTILTGEGAASTLHFPERASDSNFWRMLGHGPEGARNIVIRDLHLDGGNTHPAYVKGVPEHNHGIFLYAKGAIVENVVIENLLVENFSGDCVAIGYGCRNITVRDVAMRNFLRQAATIWNTPFRPAGPRSTSSMLADCRTFRSSPTVVVGRYWQVASMVC
jgi:polygalacturonase